MPPAFWAPTNWPHWSCSPRMPVSISPTVLPAFGPLGITVSGVTPAGRLAIICSMLGLRAIPGLRHVGVAWEPHSSAPGRPVNHGRAPERPDLSLPGVHRLFLLQGELEAVA